MTSIFVPRGAEAGPCHGQEFFWGLIFWGFMSSEVVGGFVQVVVVGSWGPVVAFSSQPGRCPGMLCAVLHPAFQLGTGGASCNAGNNALFCCAVQPSGASLAWLCFMCNALQSSPGLDSIKSKRLP